MPGHDEMIGKVNVIIVGREQAGEQVRLSSAEKLYRDIRRVGGVITGVPKAEAERTKGVQDAFYLTIPSVVALREVASVVKAWLHERPREVHITEVEDDKILHEYRVTGTVSDDTLQEFLRHAVERKR